MPRKKKLQEVGGLRLVAYYRYSGGSGQTEQSIEGQRRDCEAYAKLHGIVTLDKTRQEIADSFGIQKFSLLRCLSEFEDLGAIKIEGKKITILNSDKMKG